MKRIWCFPSVALHLLAADTGIGAATKMALGDSTRPAEAFSSPDRAKTADKGSRSAGGLYTDYFYGYSPYPLRFEWKNGQWVKIDTAPEWCESNTAWRDAEYVGMEQLYGPLPVSHYRGKGPKVNIK